MTRINIDEPRWDQSTYEGRAQHFFTVLNPLNAFISSSKLEQSRQIVLKYRSGIDLDISTEELWKAKHIFDSAYHPDTGEKMFIFGRMTFVVPLNVLISGFMLTFYKTRREVIFWQWFNQSCMALVNYTNRSGSSPISVHQLCICYTLATSGALVTALGLNSLVKSMPPLLGRLVPFAAVAAANCVNIPLMRMKELQNGVALMDENGNTVGESKKAAKRGIAAVCFSRIAMAAPVMVVPPIIMNVLEKKGFLGRRPWISFPLQLLLCGELQFAATPACCAIFPQKASINVNSLENSVQENILKLPNPPSVVYYNKGL